MELGCFKQLPKWRNTRNKTPCENLDPPKGEITPYEERDKKVSIKHLSYIIPAHVSSTVKCAAAKYWEKYDRVESTSI
jgi:hypothetical protein